MQTRRINGQQGVDGVGQLEGNTPDAAFAQLFGGGAMDVAALGIHQNTTLRSQAVGIASALLNHEKRNIDKIIESMSRT